MAIKPKMYYISKQSHVLKPYIEEFFKNRYIIRDELKNTGIDVPAFSHLVDLGEGYPAIVKSGSTASYDTSNIPVYKVLVPGYIFKMMLPDDKQVKISSGKVAGIKTKLSYISKDSGVFLSESADNLTGSDKAGYRMAYSAAGATVENNMMMLPCGANTYMYLERKSNANFRYVFLPTMHGVSTGLHESCYVVTVGYTSAISTATLTSFNAFAGEWNTFGKDGDTRFLNMFGNYFPSIPSLGFMSGSKGDAAKQKFLDSFVTLLRDYINHVELGQFTASEINEVVVSYIRRLALIDDSTPIDEITDAVVKAKIQSEAASL